MIFEKWLFPQELTSEVNDTACSACGHILSDLHLSHVNLINCSQVGWRDDLRRALHELECPSCSTPSAFGASSLIVVPEKELLLLYIPPECPIVSRDRAIDMLMSNLSDDQVEQYSGFHRKVLLNRYMVDDLVGLPLDLLPIASNPNDPSTKRVALSIQDAAISFMDEVDEALDVLLEHPECDPKSLPYFVPLNRFERTSICKKAYKQVFENRKRSAERDYAEIHSVLANFSQLEFTYEGSENESAIELIKNLQDAGIQHLSTSESQYYINSLRVAGLHGKALDVCEISLAALDSSSIKAAALPFFLQYGLLIDATQEWKLGSPIQYYLIILSTILGNYAAISDASIEERVFVAQAYQAIGVDFARRQMWLAYADNFMHSARILGEIDEDQALRQAMSVYSAAETINSHRFMTEAIDLIRTLEVGVHLEVKSEIGSQQQESLLKVILHLVDDPRGQTEVSIEDYRSSSPALKNRKLSPDTMQEFFRSHEVEFFSEMPWPSEVSEKILTGMVDQTMVDPVTIRFVDKHYDPECKIIKTELLVPLNKFRGPDFPKHLTPDLQLTKAEWLPMMEFAIREGRSAWVITTVLAYIDRKGPGAMKSLNAGEKLTCIRALSSVIMNRGIPKETTFLVGNALQTLCSSLSSESSVLGPKAEIIVIDGLAISDEISGRFDSAYARYIKSLGRALINNSFEASTFTLDSFQIRSNQMNRALRCVANAGINQTTYNRYLMLYNTVERTRNLDIQRRYLERKGFDGSTEVKDFNSDKSKLQDNEAYVQLSLIQAFMRGQTCWHRAFVFPNESPRFDSLNSDYAFELFQILHSAFTSDEFLVEGNHESVENIIATSARFLDHAFKKFEANDALDTILVNPQSYLSNVPWALLASVWNSKKTTTAVQCFSLRSYEEARKAESEFEGKLPRASVFMDPAIEVPEGSKFISERRERFSSQGLVEAIKNGGLAIYIGHGNVYLDEESSQLVFSVDDRMSLIDLDQLTRQTKDKPSVVMLLGCWAGASNMSLSLGLMNSVGLPSALKASGVDYIIASPWPVSVKLAVQFTECFLQYRNAGLSVVECFRHTYNAILEKYGLDRVFREAPGIQLYA